jgi:hypothetical protein
MWEITISREAPTEFPQNQSVLLRPMHGPAMGTSSDSRTTSQGLSSLTRAEPENNAIDILYLFLPHRVQPMVSTSTEHSALTVAVLEKGIAR